MRRLLWALAAPALLTCPFPAAAGYLITDLGNPGSGASFTALNDAGQVVGYSYATGAVAHVTLYSGGTKTDLGTLGGASTYPTGINDAGQIAGFSQAQWNRQAFLYSGGVMTNLGNLGGLAMASASAINASGQVVGWSWVRGGTSEHAFLYSGGTMTDLGSLPGLRWSFATGINASGQVVGNAATGSNAPMRAFLYSGGQMRDLGTLPGDSASNASGINASGQVVGWSSNGSGAGHAFLYSGGKMTDLGTLAGGSSSATGINDAGQVVGSSDGRAFVYSGGKMTDLNWLLPRGTLATLWSAQAINNRGQILALGTDGHGYLLTPSGVTRTPEPSTLTLLALGGAGLLGGAWRRPGARQLHT